MELNEDSILNKIVWFIRASILLDLGFIRVSDWSFDSKLEFLFKKYYEIALLSLDLKKFKLGESNVELFGKPIYYDSPYGLAGFQRMLTSHQNMLKSSGIADLGTVVDIGANVGIFSMMIRTMFPNSTIYAVEAIPFIYECLQKNLNGSLDNVFQIAMSDKEGVERMSFSERKSAFSHILAQGEEAPDTDTAILDIKATTLDIFCAANNIQKIDLLKVDTESFESNVLRGGQTMLSKTKYLAMEISISDNKNYTFSEINSLLYSKDFNFQLLSYRNFSGKGEGPLPVGDFLYKNINYERT